MNVAIAIGGLAVSLLLPAASGTSAVDTPAAGSTTAAVPTSARVDVVSVNGSGCPVSTANVVVEEDGDSFRVVFGDYLAQVGLGAKSTDNRKNCQLALDVRAPSGFTYAVTKADFSGYAYLVSGARAMVRTNYYFQGMSETSRISHSFGGPLDDNWQATDEASISELVFAPCGDRRYLNINTELRVYAGTSAADTTSYISMEQASGFTFTFARCPAGSSAPAAR